ncbi:MAG: CAP domain-containing protein [Rhodobacter sp.]|nr:CAP domain-containing protein [Rhodobacter sp.]
MILRCTLVGMAAFVAITLGTPAVASKSPANAGAMQDELLSHPNAERRAKGLSPLRLSAKLDKAAQGHGCDNANRMSMSHVSSDGRTLKNRLRRVGYAFRTAAENTGRGFASGARVVQWWMNSSKHRDNILLRKAKEVGIGIAVSPAPDNKIHWILVVGASK